MGLNKKYQEGFLAELEKSQKGELTFIPNPLGQRVGNVFNLMDSRYALISGATGSGKTSLADFEYILAPWDYLKTKNSDIYWEVNYYSLERKQLFKHAKWVSWMINRDYPDMLLSPDRIMGWLDGPMTSEGVKLVRSYDQEMSELLERVNIRDGKVEAEVLERQIRKRGLALGDLFETDDVGLRVNGSLVYTERFSDKNLVEDTPLGPEKYIEFTFQGKTHRLHEDDHKYFPKHKKALVYFIIDGINLLGDKAIIDDISVTLANARDVFGFSIVVVSQQNRAMGDIQRFKAHGSDLAPQLEDIFKSSQMGFDADLILGLFDPYRYKAWDNSGSFGGYCINPAMQSIDTGSMQTPSGINRFRSIHILKNTFGPDGNIFGLKFLGECNNFMLLPPPNSPEMSDVYADIRRGI